MNLNGCLTLLEIDELTDHVTLPMFPDVTYVGLHWNHFFDVALWKSLIDILIACVLILNTKFDKKNQTEINLWSQDILNKNDSLPMKMTDFLTT